MADYDNCDFCGSGTAADASESMWAPGCVRRFSGERFRIWRCPSCGMIHALQRVDLAKYYEDFPLHRQEMNTHARIGFRNRLRLLSELGFSRSSSLLDYGCGSGLFVSYLKSQGFSDAVGYDPFSDLHGDPSVLERKFDYVTSQDVIEHADDPRVEVKTVLEALKPGGHYVVGTPRAEGIDLAKAERFNVHIGQPYHRHIFTEASLTRFLSDYGFRERATRHGKRAYFDAPFPGASERFVLEYLYAGGGLLDTAVEKPDVLRLLRSPRLLFLLFFGSAFRPGTSMTKAYRKCA